MKRFFFGLVVLFAGVAWAVEPLKLPMDLGTLKTRDGKVLEGAKIVGHDAVGVKVIHSSGTARLTFDRLPPGLAARFPRDPDAAKRQLEKEARQDAEHESAVNDGLKPKEETADEAEADAGEPAEEAIAPVEQEVKLEGDAQASITALEAHIDRLEKVIEVEKAAADELQQKADKHLKAGTGTVTEVDRHGRTYDREIVNTSRKSRSLFYERRKEKHTKKIEEAEKLIQSARSKIFSLRRSAVTKP
jgi:hypothetical protein